MAYDDDDRVIGVTHNGRERIYGYTARGQLALVQDVEQNVTTCGYDLLGRLRTITDPNQHTKTWQYNSRDLLVAYIDEENNAYYWRYDKHNGLSWSREPLGTETERTYTTNKAGDILTVTNQRGEVTEFIRDRIGRPEAVLLHALGLQFGYKYHALGRIREMRYPDGSVWSLDYDLLGRPVGVKSPEGRTETTVYDAFGRVHQRYIGDHRDQWTFAHDENGNVIAVENPYGKEVEYVYDDLDRLHQVVPFGNPAYEAYWMEHGQRPGVQLLVQPGPLPVLVPRS